MSGSYSPEPGQTENSALPRGYAPITRNARFTVGHLLALLSVRPARSAEPGTELSRHQGHDKRPIQRLPAITVASQGRLCHTVLRLSAMPLPMSRPSSPGRSLYSRIVR
jgi:hypothetical protein